MSERWRRLRAYKLTNDPYCQSPGCDRPAEHVDHVRRIEDGGDPWNLTNLQSLCQPHHSQKTARETGFGGAHE